jgi:proton-translocating NADH-quinone oxidoreductase chain M
MQKLEKRTWVKLAKINKVIILAISLLPLLAAVLSFLSPEKHEDFQKQIAVWISCIILFLNIVLYFQMDFTYGLMQFVWRLWEIRILNSVYSVGVDSISFWFLLLNNLLIFISVSYVNKYTTNRKYFYSILFFIQLFVNQSFLVQDFFMFYVAFEAILIPMFLVIGVWGSYNRNIHASFLFFLYTLFGSLLMLLALQFLQLEVGGSTFALLSTANLSYKYQIFIFLALFIAFGVKVPMVPVHIWLPEAHGEAPTIGSVILAGILLKLGLYGMIRVLIPVCPDFLEVFKNLIYLLGLLAVTYTALVTLVQTDIKRVIAYSSVGHMNLSVLGLVSLTITGFEGSYFSLISHGFVSAGLFICVGLLYDRYGTKLITYYGGLTSVMPIFSFLLFLLTFSNIAFPGSSAFIGEFLIFTGLAATNFAVLFVASIGVILTAFYSVWTYNRLVFGPVKNLVKFSDLNIQEIFTLSLLVVPVLILGVYPSLLTDTIHLSTLRILP